MKNIFRIVLSSMLCIACTQDDSLTDSVLPNNEIEQNTKFNEESITAIRHQYDYYGKIFRVTYFLDTQESKVASVEGAIEMAIDVFGKESGDKAIVFRMDEVNTAGDESSTVWIKSKVFDTYSEVKEYLGHKNSETTLFKNQKNECYDIDTYGPIDYRFYNDIDYFDEMSGVTGFKRKEYSKYHLGAYNDRMSSFRCSSIYQWEVSMTLFEDICRAGKSYTFFKPHNSPNLSVDDLRPYTLSGWWFWRQSWNDNVSSFSATSKRP